MTDKRKNGEAKGLSFIQYLTIVFVFVSAILACVGIIIGAGPSNKVILAEREITFTSTHSLEVRFIWNSDEYVQNRTVRIQGFDGIVDQEYIVDCNLRCSLDFVLPAPPYNGEYSLSVLLISEYGNGNATEVEMIINGRYGSPRIYRTGEVRYFNID